MEFGVEHGDLDAVGGERVEVAVRDATDEAVETQAAAAKMAAAE